MALLDTPRRLRYSTGVDLPETGSRSAWPGTRIEAFLRSFGGPLRLAVNGPTGHPVLCSLWYEFGAGELRCATSADAHVARLLGRDPRCAFEVAPNEPPYRGVRGRGRARLCREGAPELLGRLIDRYLGGRDPELAAWLLSRAESERAVIIEPEWWTAWDYSGRMRSPEAG